VEHGQKEQTCISLSVRVRSIISYNFSAATGDINSFIFVD